MKLTTAVLAALALLTAHSAGAVSISGDIAFGTAPGAFWTPANAALVSGPGITTANAAGIRFTNGSNPSSIDDGIVTTGFGDYAGVVPGTFVDFNNFVFSPLVSGTQLWTFSSGSNTYSFTMSTISIVNQTTSIISLEGTGIASITGLDDTAGTFTLTLNQSGRAFSFSSSAAVVPVPAALWLFASGLLGLVGTARRKGA